MSDIRVQKAGEPDVLQTSDGRLTLSVPILLRVIRCLPPTRGG